MTVSYLCALLSCRGSMRARSGCKPCATLTEGLAFQKHEFEVAMTCEGCSGAVTRILSKLGDEVKFEIDLPKRLVWIESEKDVDFLTDTLKKCGKEVKYNGTK
ncbi:unnamed protein product [Lota lota]